MQRSTEQIYVPISEVESRERIALSLDYKERIKKSDAWKELAQILQKEQKLLRSLVLVFAMIGPTSLRISFKLLALICVKQACPTRSTRAK